LGQNGLGNLAEFLCYDFSSFEYYPYPFFYRLEGARVFGELSAMHGWEFQLTDKKLFVPAETFLIFCFVR
jgi:hypothetical protein